MPRQKQDRPKRTKCSAIESTSETGQESNSPGDTDNLNLDEGNSSSSSSTTSSSSSSRSSSPQPSSQQSPLPSPTMETPIEEDSGRQIIIEDNDNNNNNNSNYYQQTPLSPIREESLTQEPDNLGLSPLPITTKPHKQSSSSPPPASSLQLSQSPTNMSTDQQTQGDDENIGIDPPTDEQTSSLTQSSPHPLILPQDSRASSPSQNSPSPDVKVNNNCAIEDDATDGTMEPRKSPITIQHTPTPSTSTRSLSLTSTSSSIKQQTSCIVRKRKVSTTDSMMASTATEKTLSPPPASSSSSSSSDHFVKPLSTNESGIIASTLKGSTSSKPNIIEDKLMKDLNQSSLINSLILNSRTSSLILPPQKPVPPPPPLSTSGVSPAPINSSGQQKSQQQPIYVAISTNPLILVPLSYNSETGGLDLSLNNSTGGVKLPEEILSSSQLNGSLIADRSTLLGNTLEAHRNNLINNNRNNLINGLFDSSNIISVNSLTNNNIISINNNISDNNESIISNRNTILNNINIDCPSASISRKPQSSEGPLDLSSSQSNDYNPHQHNQDNSVAFRHRYRLEHERTLSSSSSSSTTAPTTLKPYKVKSEADPMMEDSESPAPLNLFNSPSNFTNLASSSRDLPQPSSVIAAAAAAAAAAAVASQASPSSVGPSLPGPIPSLPTPFTPEAVFKQSSYHCEHCHIGFYKKENYTIHKRHYCSARRTQAAAAAAVAAAAAAAAMGTSRQGTGNTRTGSESSPDILESDGSPDSSPEISLDSDKIHHSSTSRIQNVSSLRGSRRVSISSKTNASNSSNSPGSSPPHQPLSQYYCVACGIRFTSLDNLQAHQTYYCLKRNSVNSSPDKLQYIVSIPGGTGSEVSCVKCKATYCNEEAFLSHVCSAMSLGAISSSSAPNQTTPNGLNKSLTGSASSPNFNTNGNDGRYFSAGSGRSESETDQQCFRCTICGYKGQTLQGMRIHVRMHSQCFRCTICGYKGHTLRGMRTHVRIHQDKIQGLPEETFIACIEDEALVTKSSRNGPSGPKRRRKSLEAFGANINIPHQQYSFSSVISENSKPQLLSGLVSSLTPSTSTPTTTSSTAGGVLAVSFGSNNVRPINSTQIGLNNNINNNNSNNNNNLNSSHSEISSENDDEAASNISENETSGREDSRQGGSGESLHNCQFCYYSSTYKGNVVRHVKLVHKDVNSRNGSSPPASASFSGLSKRELNDDGTGGDSLGSINDDLPLDLKSTRSNGFGSQHNLRNGSPNNLEPSSPVDQNTLSNGPTSNRTNNNNNSLNQTKKAVPKYCRSCDISFQFLTSFIAHKKYYCSSHSNETNAMQPLPESKSPV